MADGRDGHDVGLGVNGVDDAIVTRSNAQVRTVANELRCASRARLCFEAVDNLGDRLTYGRIKLPERTRGPRPDIDLVAGHTPDSTSPVRS